MLSGADLTPPWRTSRRCESGSCVEVATMETVVAVRDSTRPDGSVLQFAPADWTGFMADIQAERHQAG